MTYQEVQEAMPKRLWDKVHNAMRKCHKHEYEDKVKSLKGEENNTYSTFDSFPNIGEFINWSMYWDATDEGHLYWSAVKEFYSQQ